MKKGLILNNAYSNLKSAINQSARLKEEFEKTGVEITVKPNNFFPAVIDKNGNIESIVSGYDFCVYLDKDKYISQMLEKCNLKLFNSHNAICDCDDKMVTAIRLADNGIAMPLTIPGLLCYDESAKLQPYTAGYIESKLGYPVIIKESYGSLGKGVYKADNRNELINIMDKVKCVPHLFQKFIKESSGTDLRVIVVGGECVAAMKRTSENDFRSNIELGGKGEAYVLSEELKKLCGKVSRVLGLDYCGIDILFGKENYLVCEVNSNAFFGGIEKVTGVNVASLYAGYIYKKIYC